ncbi:dihydrodipicolinate reductase C-terminal domain-containing protein [Candidatus Tremblaya princeps]|uniref:dihydrodipicolinate reductase C-terminal domain-containing protein n=1 Tax=Tremblaya princeps TaxID=189385 RepID=UPI0009467D8E
MHKLRTKKNPYVSKTLALVLRYLACEYAARLYAGYDFGIVEVHTVTSTSGTFHPALRLPLRHCVASTQHGVSVFSLRWGGVVGDHAVFMMGDDVVVIEHRSTTLLHFATGAVEGACDCAL